MAYNLVFFDDGHMLMLENCWKKTSPTQSINGCFPKDCKDFVNDPG